MKQQQEKSRGLSLSGRIMAGFLALLMLAGTVFGVIAYLI